MPRPSRPAPEVLHLRMHAPTRAILEQIKRDCGLSDDASAIRQALSLQAWLARRIAAGDRIFLGNARGTLTDELILPNLERAPA